MRTDNINKKLSLLTIIILLLIFTYIFKKHSTKNIDPPVKAVFVKNNKEVNFHYG